MHCSPHQTAGRNTAQIMRLVVTACLPGVVVSTWFFGIGTLLNILLAVIAAIAFEAFSLRLRHQAVRWSLADNSALVTAVLLGIALPPGCDWWLVLSGIFVAIVISKQVFGGLGHNPFNPAMCGYVFLLLSFPLEMTSWQIPVAGRDDIDFNPLDIGSLIASLRFTLAPLSAVSIDGLAIATPLLEQKLAASSAINGYLESGGSLLGLFDHESQAGWELVNFAYLLGGLFLLFKRIISWHIPVSIIATVTALSLIFYSNNSAFVVGSPYLHLFGTATMLGAFFIATDPVSSASTPRGKLLYGMIIGLSMYSIRVWGSYPDSVAFAVLAGNLFAPLIDRITLPGIYGHRRTGP
ncbi:MAG: RnfABCDGE type electron transport complex subunit D [Gammaproteobacteria bacterium]|nr:RnfABCDGE type electron transport complex subunit D [Gammaproteobacteria bacterium]